MHMTVKEHQQHLKRYGFYNGRISSSSSDAYGSHLFDLIDAPYSSTVKLAIIAATAEALMTWEPRIDVEDVVLRTYEPGHIVINLTGRYLPNGLEVTLEGIEIG